jgi:hypothetical protein
MSAPSSLLVDADSATCVTPKGTRLSGPKMLQINKKKAAPARWLCSRLATHVCPQTWKELMEVCLEILQQ